MNDNKKYSLQEMKNKQYPSINQKLPFQSLASLLRNQQEVSHL